MIAGTPRTSSPRPRFLLFGGSLLREPLLWLSLLASCIAGGCKPTPEPAEPDFALEQGPRSEPLEFSFPGGEDLVVSSETTRGRVTALAFVATYDMASQLMLRHLADVIVRFTPRANAAAVVVEAPRYADLLPAYRDSLQLPFPVVMVDFITQQGQGPFASIQRVPTLVVLDKAGREVARRQGAMTAGQIEDELRNAARSRP